MSATNDQAAQRAVVVTGYSSGIGLAIARDFVRAGRQLVGIARKPAPEARAELAELGRRHGAPEPQAFEADVSDLGALRSVAASLAEAGVDVGVVVAAAGVNVRKPAVELAESEARHMVDTNVLGAFFTVQAFSDAVLRTPGGRVIIIGSVSGRQGMRLRAMYSATKAAMSGLTRALSVEWAPLGATVNCVAPGIIDTPLTSGYFDKNPQMRERVAEATPAGRVGRPEDVAHVVSFLAQPGSDFITGETIATDGGLTISNTWW